MEVGHRDDLWLVQDVLVGAVDLINTRTREDLTLKNDHIQEYRSDSDLPAQSDGFLLLLSEVQIRNGKVTVEPLHYRHALDRLSESVKTLETQFDVSLRLAQGFVIEGPCPLQIFAVGERCCIEVLAFGARFAGLGRTVYYNSGSISGLPPDKTHYVYGTDPARRGGAIPYLASANLWEAFDSAENFYVGRIFVPKGSTR